MDLHTTDLITYAEAAARWGVSARTVARHVEDGNLTTFSPAPGTRLMRLDPLEVAAVFNKPEVRGTVAEAATALLVASALDEPDTYKQVRDVLDADTLNAVSVVLGGADRIAQMDTRVGYDTEKR